MGTGCGTAEALRLRHAMTVQVTFRAGVIAVDSTLSVGKHACSLYIVLPLRTPNDGRHLVSRPLSRSGRS
jgi:hypothetical protein